MEGKRSPERGAEKFIPFPQHPLSNLLKSAKRYHREMFARHFEDVEAEANACIFEFEQQTRSVGKNLDYENLTDDDKKEILRLWSRRLREAENALGISVKHKKRERKLTAKDPDSDSDVSEWHPAYAVDTHGPALEKKAAEINMALAKNIILESEGPEPEAQWEAFKAFAEGEKISVIAQELGVTVPKAKKILEQAIIAVEVNRDKFTEPEQEREVA